MHYGLLLAALVVAIGLLVRMLVSGPRLSPATVVGLGMVGLLVVAALYGDTSWFRTEPPVLTGQRPGQQPGQRPNSGPPTQRSVPPIASAEGVPRLVRADGYQSSATCRECHQEQHASWHDTFHRTMTQVATPESVVAPLDQPVRLEAYGRTCIIQRRGKEFWVRMPDPDWEVPQVAQGVDLREITDAPQVDRRIVMTTGSHHLQGYWVATADGLRQVPWEYHRDDQRWMPLEDVFLRPPDAGRMFGHWNSSCIQCHSVNPVPGYQPDIGGFNSRVAELGIACEACHGPGEEHIRRHRQPGASASAGGVDPTILNPARCPPEVSARICGQCHATFEAHDQGEFLRVGHRHRAGEDLAKSRQLVRFDHPARELMAEGGTAVYWGDRACRVGGAEYLGLLESQCYKAGQMSCVSCHSLHDSKPNDQLAAGMDGNQACLQCHEKFRERIEEHTHHPTNSAGSLCYNCHMPHTTYALLAGQRTHRIDSPNVESSVRHGRPNACNLCHLDQTLDWAAQKLSDWYGTPPVTTSEDEQHIAASILWLLRGDALQRALSAWHMGWPAAQEASGNEWQGRVLPYLLDDPYPAVRYLAHRALVTLPGTPSLPFDFVGPPADRVSVQQQLLKAAAAEAPGQPPRTELLLAPDGSTRGDLIDRLRRQRDDRRVNIPE